MAYNSEDIKKMIELNGEAIIPTIISKLITDHNTTADKMKRYYNRYTGVDVPIRNRINKDKAGVALNNKIHIDHEGIIIDEIKGYIFGYPIKTEFNSEAEAESKIVNGIIQKLETINNNDALNEETGELSSVCGYAGRLVYFDTDGQLRIMNTKPWETIFIVNNSTELVEYALIYYDWDIVDYKTGRITKTTKVEWYDKSNVYYYFKSGSKYIIETSQETGYKNPQQHFFQYVPVIKFKANNLEQSDLEKVVGLIDSYDELISDAQNEIQEFVHAYLKTTGAELPAEERIALRMSGVINLPDKDASVDFLTKNINGDFFEQQKKTLREEIYNTSKSVNMSDEKFNAGGVESGEARKWKLLPLEFKAITKERKFTEGLLYQWQVITSAVDKEFTFDYLQLEFTFIRNLPIDYLYYAEVANKLLGILPKIDILSRLPFVKNPKETYDKLEQESDVNLDKIPTELDLESRVQKLLADNASTQ